MRVLKFSFQGYRNLHEGTLLPHAGTNVIFGKNAQGKTNLLEAMWLFTGGHSFRGAKDAELVGSGSRPAACKWIFQPGKGTICKTFFTKRPPAGRIKWSEETFGRVPGGEILRGCVFPGPFVSGQGWPRRAPGFLDGALCQSRPAYAKEFFLYQRTLQQRNALLKDIPRHRELFSTLEIWTRKLPAAGRI